MRPLFVTCVVVPSYSQSASFRASTRQQKCHKNTRTLIYTSKELNREKTTYITYVSRHQNVG
jgi:hypothetical protein